MGIRVDPDNCVHYHELLYRNIRRLFGTHSLLQELDMQLFELMTLCKIEDMTERSYLKIAKKHKQDAKVNCVHKHNHFTNPLFTRILGVKAFQAWLNLAKKEMVQEQHVEIP